MKQPPYSPVDETLHHHRPTPVYPAVSVHNSPRLPKLIFLDPAGALLALRDFCMLRRRQGLQPLSPHPFLRCGILPTLRSDKFLLTKPNTSGTIEMPASLRSDGGRGHPECRSASFRIRRSALPESPLKKRRYSVCQLYYCPHKRRKRATA